MDRLAVLQAIANLSEEMLAAAKNSQWELLQALEYKEREYLANLKPPSQPLDIEGQDYLIRVILENHAVITSLVKPLHHDLKVLLEAFPQVASPDR